MPYTSITRVFWDVEDFPPPLGCDDLLPVVDNIKKALDDACYPGNVSICAYGPLQNREELDFYRGAGIMFMAQEDEKRLRVDRMLMDMIHWAFRNPTQEEDIDEDSRVDINLFVISKIHPEDSALVKVVQELSNMCYQMLLVDPDDCSLGELPPTPSCQAKEILPFVVLVWRWESLLRGGEPLQEYDDDTTTDAVCAEPMSQGAIVPTTTDAVCKTASVFWDVEDFPLPADCDLCWFRENLKERLRKQGILGDVSITAYGEEKPAEVVSRYKDAGITFVSKGNKYWRLVLMMADIGLWTLGHRDVYNYDKTVLMLIVKDDKDTEFNEYVQNLDWVMCLSVFYVLADQEPGPVPMVQEAWFWEKLLEGEEPMPQEEYRKICSQLKRNVKSSDSERAGSNNINSSDS